jgi:hypothetical protein
MVCGKDHNSACISWAVWILVIIGDYVGIILVKVGFSKMGTFNALIQYLANLSPWESNHPLPGIGPKEVILNRNKNPCSGSCIAIWLKMGDWKAHCEWPTLGNQLCRSQCLSVEEYCTFTEVTCEVLVTRRERWWCYVEWNDQVP